MVGLNYVQGVKNENVATFATTKKGVLIEHPVITIFPY
jgi:hypothetical protein